MAARLGSCYKGMENKKPTEPMSSDRLVTSDFDLPPWFYADLTATVCNRTLKDVLAHWESLKDGADLPKASRIDPFDLRPHLGDLFMVRVGNQGQDFIYSLIGTRITGVLDRDTTGQRVEDTFPEDHPILSIYRLIHDRRIPVRTHGQLSWVHKDYKRFESVMMPLVDDEGTVIKILGAAVYFSDA